MTERVHPADVWWPEIPAVEPDADRRLAHLPARVALEGGALGGPSEATAGRRGALVKLLDVGRRVDLYVVAADVRTTADDVVEGVRELVGLAVRFGESVEVHPSIDGVPDDASAAAAVAAGVFAPGLDPQARVDRLRGAWEGEASEDAALRVRRLDDLVRRLTFDMLEDAYLYRSTTFPGQPMRKHVAVDRAVAMLGEANRWKRQVRMHTFGGTRRMVVIPTWQCELRCAYCFIPKQDGRTMTPETVDRAVDFLFSTDRDAVELQFFGGEALIEADLVRRAMTRAVRRGAETGKGVGFILSSNGWSLTPENLAWLADFPVRLELSLDGKPETQRKYRPSRYRHEDSYAHSIATHAGAIQASGIPHWVIMVVHPLDVDQMPANFFHIADLGFGRIQINNMLGRVWTPEQMASFARGLHAIGLELRRRWAAGQTIEFINMNHSPLAMRLNGEVTVDWDGTIFGGNQFLHETENKPLFKVGHLDEATGIDRYWIDQTDNNFLLLHGYKPHVTDNNVEVGKILASFIQWMNRDGFGPRGPLSASERAALASKGRPPVEAPAARR
jgi:pyruvate-formate lyase-activating enzyme